MEMTILHDWKQSSTILLWPPDDTAIWMLYENKDEQLEILASMAQSD